MIDRLIDADLDARLIFNQKTTALLLGISPQAFSRWAIAPVERQGKQTFYYWPDVRAEMLRRQAPKSQSDGAADGEEEDLHFSRKITAKLLGISVQAFAKWGLKPARSKGREALYHWPDVHAEFIRRRYDRAGAPQGGLLDLDQERARHAKEQADKLALENAGSRGELIFTEHMAEVMGRALGAFRARLLSAATKLAPRVNPGNPNLARELIDREHNDVLAELSNFDPGAELGEHASGDN